MEYFEILELLDNEDVISQREIAKRTGFSLGSVNLIIKQCVKKGFVKIEKLDAKRLRYILTPKGLNEKARKTVDYVKRIYSVVHRISNKLDKILAENSGKNIILVGDNDEIYSIIRGILAEKSVKYRFSRADSDDIKNICKDSLILVWDIELENIGENTVNLLK